jgi:hypothetical protein
MKTWELAKKYEFKFANFGFQAPFSVTPRLKILNMYPFLAAACDSSFISANQKATFYDRLSRQQWKFGICFQCRYFSELEKLE